MRCAAIASISPALLSSRAFSTASPSSPQGACPGRPRVPGACPFVSSPPGRRRRLGGKPFSPFPFPLPLSRPPRRRRLHFARHAVSPRAAPPAPRGFPRRLAMAAAGSKKPPALSPHFRPGGAPRGTPSPRVPGGGAFPRAPFPLLVPLTPLGPLPRPPF